MADYYSGAESEIERFLAEIVSIGAAEADTMGTSDIALFQEDIDQEIDGVLSQVYFVPLTKVKRGTVSIYPEPIPLIAKKLVAAHIISIYYKGITASNAANDVAKRIREEAYFSLNALVNDPLSAGSSRLRGQKLKGRNRFVRPQIAPSPSGSPTSGPSGGTGLA